VLDCAGPGSKPLAAATVGGVVCPESRIAGDGSAPTVNAISIDFEDWYHGIEIPPCEWDGFEDRIGFSGRRILELLSEARVRGTFFVLGHLAERHPELVREIVAEGHELATHGYSHTFVYRQKPEEFRSEIERSMGFLQDVSGHSVIGFRAPYFSLTSECLWAFDILADCGIKYDSSVFPVRNYRYGIQQADRWPYEIKCSSRTISELPPSTWAGRHWTLPVAGGAYFRIYPYYLTRRAFRAINREGRPAVFYLHPWEVDPWHPRIALPRRISLTHYWNLGATERRLGKLLQEFRFAPMGEVFGITAG
jgi:polysaccharide deacetylase family protein (PEP-CTERM system associated)